MGRGTVSVPRATRRRPYAGVVATEGSVESLPLASLGDFVRGRMPPSGMISEAGRQVDNLFESLLVESFETG